MMEPPHSKEWEQWIRADERERDEFTLHVVREYVAFAEAVAAKLVEVICDDAAVMAWDLKALEATARERDAARAEVRALLHIRTVVEAESAKNRAQRDAAQAEARVAESEVRRISAEVAALREEVAHAWAVANGEARR